MRSVEDGALKGGDPDCLLALAASCQTELEALASMDAFQPPAHLSHLHSAALLYRRCTCAASASTWALSWSLWEGRWML